MPVELVWNTAVTKPLSPPGAAGLNYTISYNVVVAVSPSPALISSFP
ncbi:MAG TPA: hypothetical protein VI037_01515 [Nitrososphaera sp.]